MSRLRMAIDLVVLVALGWSFSPASHGEIVILTHGGQVVGEIVNAPSAAKDTITIKTASGGQITLAKAQVEEIVHQRPAEVEYEKIRTRYADSVEGQWELAEWCREHTLIAPRERHLKRIIELDPNHQKARWALGYSQIGGQWTTKEEVMLKQGMKYYKGRWRLPQEIELIEERHKVEVAEKEWKQKLNRWRDWLGTDRARLGKESILQIEDPMAVKALAGALKDDQRAAARLLFVEVLARIGTPEAKMHLAVCSIEDPVEEVRMTCLDHLKKEKNPEVVAYFTAKLRSKDNNEINLAAVGLREMGDRSAIGPLIDSLVTIHKRKIAAGNPGQVSTSFGTRGTPGGGLSAGGGGPKIITYQMSNRAVLDALVALAGGPNFSFEVAQWRTWFAAQKKSQFLDARRD